MKQMLLNTREDWIELFTTHLIDVGGKVGVSMDFLRAISGKAKKSLKLNVQTETVDSLVNRILQLPIPTHKIGNSSVSFKPNSVDLQSHLERFFSIYQYKESVVYEAIKGYIEEVNNEDSKYKKALKYFIHKQGEGSGLADYCDKILAGEDLSVNEYSRFELR